MPKKSKKNKLLAESRRKKQAENLLSYNFVKSQSTDAQTVNSGVIEPTQEKNKNIAATAQTNVHSIDNKHLRADLIKILLFTIFAIFSQFVLYYLLRG